MMQGSSRARRRYFGKGGWVPVLQGRTDRSVCLAVRNCDPLFFFFLIQYNLNWLLLSVLGTDLLKGFKGFCGDL